MKTIGKIAPILFVGLSVNIALAQPHPITNSPPLPPLPPGLTAPHTGQSFRQFSNESLSSPPGNFDDSGDSGASSAPAFSFPPFDTNGLWLEITGVSTNGLAYFNLHNATNQVYALQTTTNVPNGWNVELELWPTNALVMPFTLQTLNRTNLFVRALDWTGVTENGNTTPDWWLWKYFGTTALSDSTLDSTGQNTLVSDYLSGTDPNVIAFSVSATNNYISTSATAVQLNVSQGTPFNFAVLVDSTNFSAATWNIYTSSNAPVVLGLTEGWHDVGIGLRGKPADATVIWQWKRLKLDYTPPALVVTGPTNSTAAVQIVQVTGYSPEALASISYDISNAMATVTNELAVITGQTYSANTAEFTTNFFQCYDVPLASGLNAITIHATDLAGNTTTVVTNITYIATTNLPTVSLVWPQDGMQISGSNIALQGRVDDPTANVVVATVDNDGNTNTFSGLTGRDGIFWAENVPLYCGTNQFLITVSNAAGSIATNIVVVQSSTALTINTVQAGDTTVTGTIGTNGYTVWVNGNQATNDGTGSWTAQISAVGVGGGEVVAAAIPNSDNGGNGSGGDGATNSSSGGSINAQATVQPPQGALVSAYHRNYQSPYPFDADAFWMIFETNFWYCDILDWDGKQGGTEDTFYIMGFEITFPVYDHTVWPANNWPEPLPDGTWNHLYWDYDQYAETTTVVTESSEIGSPGLAQEHCDMRSPGPYVPGATERRTADAEMELATGGPLGSTQKNLWCLTARAVAYDNIADTGGASVPFDQIQIGSYGNLDTNGELWVMLPDNDPDVITPRVSGNANYTFTVGATKYTLQHNTVCTASGNKNNSRTTIGVGEQVVLYGMPDNTIWTQSGGGSLSATNGPSITLTANLSPIDSTVTAEVGNAKTSVLFKVLAPTGIKAAFLDDSPVGIPGTTNRFIGGITEYSFTILPDTVSFANVHFRENLTNFSILWPDHTNHPIISAEFVLFGGSGGCNQIFIDQIGDGVKSSDYYSWLFNGTNYQAFSYTHSWKDQYQDQSGSWKDFVTLTATSSYSSNGQWTATYEGISGHAQGPYEDVASH